MKTKAESKIKDKIKEFVIMWSGCQAFILSVLLMGHIEWTGPGRPVHWDLVGWLVLGIAVAAGALAFLGGLDSIEEDED